MMSMDEQMAVLEEALAEARSAVTRARRALVTAALAIEAAQDAAAEVRFRRGYEATMAEYRALTSPVTVPDHVPDQWSRD